MRFPGVLAVASILAGSAPRARAETTVEIRPTGDTASVGTQSVGTQAVAEAPARIKIGFVNATVSLDRARLELRVEPHAIAGKLVLSYSSPDAPKNIVVPLELPHGTAMERLVVTTGPRLPPTTSHFAHRVVDPRIPPRQVRLVGKSQLAATAREHYERATSVHRDPALLEWRGSDGTVDRLQLEVFPIGGNSIGVVELGFELPRTTKLVLDPDGQMIDKVDVSVAHGTARRTRSTEWLRDPLAIELPQTRALDSLAPRASNVSSTHSLVALPRDLPARIVPRIVIGCGVSHRAAGTPVTQRSIRKTVRAAQPRLLACFMRAKQANPALVGGMAHFHFTIVDGKTTEISIDGELDHPEVRACMTADVARWQFPSEPRALHDRRPPDRVRVNYPMHFSAR